MENYRFIYKNNDDYILGEIKNNRLVDYTKSYDLIFGNIYRAYIKDYSKSMNAYILDIGLEKDAILRNNNVLNSYKKGNQIIVELIRQSNNYKMHEVSEKITLSNKYVVLFPYKKKFIDNFDKYQPYSYILRENANNISDIELYKFYEKLKMEFEKIKLEKNKLPTPKLIKKKDYIEEYVNNYDGKIISNIFIENTIYDKKFNPKYNKVISLDLAKSFERKVEVKNANIIIDKLEALTVIDINSGYTGIFQNKEEMSFNINNTVLEEIAIQIKLRKIKKMLIIDFLRMNNKNKNILIENVEKVFNDYKIKYKILGYSNLDFLELIIF